MMTTLSTAQPRSRTYESGVAELNICSCVELLCLHPFLNRDIVLAYIQSAIAVLLVLRITRNSV